MLNLFLKNEKNFGVISEYPATLRVCMRIFVLNEVRMTRHHFYPVRGWVQNCI